MSAPAAARLRGRLRRAHPIRARLAPALLAAAWLLASSAAGAEDASACGPFPPEAAHGVAGPDAARSVATAGAEAATAPILPETTDPAASGATPAADDAPEPSILLVLPRTPAGDLGEEDLALAPGARIVASFWSPVLCAAVARVAGPPGRAAATWVERVPAGAAVVPDTVYTSGADEAVRPADDAAPRGPAAEPAGDPYRPLQHGLDALGVERARPVTDGRGVRVGVVDSRPADDHPDLPPTGPPDATGRRAPGRHGTLVAGVLGAVEDNGIGIVGVAPGAELVALPACEPGAAPDAPDRCALFDLLGAFDRAWDARTAVLNVALVGDANPVLERAVARLDALGVLVVAAAGNDGGDAPRYPAAYPSVIGVGALDRAGARWARGNRGDGAEILAPGVDVVSTVPGGGFAFADGTSLAAAHVSGTLALLAAASGDPAAARTALFQAGHADPRADARAAVLAPVCDALGRLGRPCPDR